MATHVERVYRDTFDGFLSLFYFLDDAGSSSLLWFDTDREYLVEMVNAAHFLLSAVLMVWDEIKREARLAEDEGLERLVALCGQLQAIADKLKGK